MTVLSRIQILRLVGTLLALTYGWWLIAYFRTMTFGNGEILMCLLIGMLYVFPISLLPFLGFSARRVVRYAIVVLIVALGSALIWATAQEYTVTRNHTAAQEQYIPRWWPFENHAITYSPETGWKGQD